ncbi:MAG: SH3 domain-containing protein [Sarcina sp.]
MKIKKILISTAVLAAPIALLPVHGKKHKNINLLASRDTSTHQNLLNLIQYKNDRVSAFSEATQLHGSTLDNCVYYVSSLLRKDNFNVPDNMGNVAQFKNWVTNSDWNISTNIDNLQPGDVCFAGNTHTFIFVSWYDKSKGLANVDDNQIAYFNPDKATYVRNLNGSNGGNYLPGCGNDNSYMGVTSFATPPTSNPIGIVSSKYMPLHFRSSIDGQLIGSIPTGTRLSLLDKKDGWYKVKYNNQIGWVAGWYIIKQK